MSTSSNTEEFITVQPHGLFLLARSMDLSLCKIDINYNLICPDCIITVSRIRDKIHENPVAFKNRYEMTSNLLCLKKDFQSDNISNY